MAENIEGRPPILGLGEVVLWVRDLEMSSAFYSEVLDFHIQDVGDGKTAVINVGHPEFADFGQNLILFQHPDPAQDWPVPQEQHGTPRTASSPLHHLAFAIHIAEYNGHINWLAHKGIETETGTHKVAGERSIYFNDPDGNLIELVAEDLSLLEDAG